jgi:CubicO group peptidase (beta-lactamase class C family)
VTIEAGPAHISSDLSSSPLSAGPQGAPQTRVTEEQKCGRRRGVILLVGVTAWLLALGTAEAIGVWPGSTWASRTPAQVGVDATKLNQAVNYAKGFGGSGIVVRNGYRIAYWGSQTTLYELKSATKSFGSILLGLAVKDLKLGLGDQVQPKLSELGVPPDSNKATGWLDDITVQHLATHTAGFEKTGGFGTLLFQPGTKWSYSDGGTNWLADLVTVTYGQDLSTVLRNRVLQHLQISTTDLTWRTNSYRPKTLPGNIPRREFGSGIRANVNAMARIGLMMARGGLWNTRQLLSSDYVQAAGTTPSWLKDVPLYDPAKYPTAPRRYGLLWWNNASGVISGLPTDAFWAWGLAEQLILVVPSLDLVAARAGPAMGTSGFGNTKALQPFFGPLGQSVTR